MLVDPHPGLVAPRPGERLRLAGDLVQPELRQSGERFRGLLGALLLEQGFGFAADLRNPLAAHGRLQAGQPLSQPVLALRRDGAAGRDDGADPVLILHEPTTRCVSEDVRLPFPPLAQGRYQRGEAQRLYGIEVVQPADHRAEEVLQRALWRDFPPLELYLVERRLDEVAGQPVPGDGFQGGEGERLDLSRFLFVGAAQSDDERQLPVPTLQAGTGRQVLAKPGIDQRLAQRSGGVAHQRLGQHLQNQSLRRVAHRRCQPGYIHGGLALQRLVGPGRVAAFHSARCGPPRLLRHRGIDIEAGEPLKLPGKEGQVVGGCYVPVKEDAAVARRVEAAMELPETLIRQVRDPVRVSARLDAIGGVGEERLYRGALGDPLRRRVGSLHLVVHDAAHRESAVIAHLQVMSLLPERVLPQERAQHEIGVYRG